MNRLRAYINLRPYLLPISLGGLGLLLLARILLAGADFAVAQDFGTLVLVLLVGGIMVVALHSLVRLSMSYLRTLSIRRARRETLAEHARFLRRLDHELKNPLTALRAGLKTLTLTGLSDAQAQMVEMMEAETLTLTRLVTDLRKLAELEIQPLSLGRVDLAELLGEASQAQLERAGSAKELTVTVQPPGLGWHGDADLLALALHNLLDNAFKYTQADDKITLSATLSPGPSGLGSGDLVIQVADTGAGIDEADLPHVWDELYRGAQLVKVPGSGIGLALVKAIVERHGGRATLASEPGQGVTVTLHLPGGILPDGQSPNGGPS